MTRVDKAAFVSAFITGLCLYAAARSPIIRAVIELARMSPEEPDSRHTPGDTVTYLTDRHERRPR